MVKLTKITIHRFIIIIVIILALAGWTRPFHPTADNLNNAANDVIQENPNLAVVLYTVADALDEGYIYPLAFVTSSFQEQFILKSVEIPEKNEADIDA